MTLSVIIIHRSDDGLRAARSRLETFNQSRQSMEETSERHLESWKSHFAINNYDDLVERRKRNYFAKMALLVALEQLATFPNELTMSLSAYAQNFRPMTSPAPSLTSAWLQPVATDISFNTDHLETYKATLELDQSVVQERLNQNFNQISQ